MKTGVVVATGVAAVVTLAGCSSGTTAGHPTDGPAIKKLSHTAVERYISAQFGASAVLCNGGRNFSMRTAGQTFKCTSSTSTYTVTVKDPAIGRYVVKPTK